MYFNTKFKNVVTSTLQDLLKICVFFLKNNRNQIKLKKINNNLNIKYQYFNILSPPPLPLYLLFLCYLKFYSLFFILFFLRKSSNFYLKKENKKVENKIN